MPDLPSHVLFRADASPEIGGGHIMRCMALAEVLARRSKRVSFVTTAETITTVPVLADAGYGLLEVVSSLSLAETLKSHGVSKEAMLIVDHYGVEVSQLAACRGVLDQIVAIDDLANGPHDCDLLLNQGKFDADGLYLGKLPGHAKVLAGPQFALLRPDFNRLREASLARRRGASLDRVFISFGLTDVGGWALWAARTLAGGPFTVDVAVGSGAGTIADLRTLASCSENIRLHVDAQNVAELMAVADIAIGAGGSTSWERCTLGLPSIIAVVADNQRAIAEELSAAGAARMLTSKDYDELLGLLNELRCDPVALEDMQDRASCLCDGLGAERFADAIAGLSLPDPTQPVLVRPSTAADRADFWLIRNNSAVRAVSGDRSEIPWSGHVAWWRGALTAPGRELFSAEQAGRMIGYVRFDVDETGDFATSIALAPQYQGKGLGSKVLAGGLEQMWARHHSVGFTARIHQNNVASIRMFKRLGFEETGIDQDFCTLRLQRSERKH